MKAKLNLLANQENRLFIEFSQITVDIIKRCT